METNIKLLEERVTETVERLRALSAERDRLRGELEALRNRLVDAGEGDGGNGASHDARRDAEIAEVLRLAAEELREE